MMTYEQIRIKRKKDIRALLASAHDHIGRLPWMVQARFATLAIDIGDDLDHNDNFVSGTRSALRRMEDRESLPVEQFFTLEEFVECDERPDEYRRCTSRH